MWSTMYWRKYFLLSTLFHSQQIWRWRGQGWRLGPFIDEVFDLSSIINWSLFALKIINCVVYVKARLLALWKLMSEHHLLQLVNSLTRNSNLLNLVIVNGEYLLTDLKTQIIIITMPICLLNFKLVCETCVLNVIDFFYFSIKTKVLESKI